MAFFRTSALGLFLLLGLQSIPAMSQDDAASREPTPALPPEEQPMEPVEGEPESSVVLNYEEPMRADFFADRKGRTRFFNAFEIAGNFRTRFAYFRNPHLATYIPSLNRGTSSFMPNLSIYEEGGTEANPAQNNFSGNMRLRLDPTIHVSESMRVRSTLDIFDNMVLGSTPSYMSAGSFNPSVPVSMMSMSQNSPAPGVNSLQSAIMVKRAWGEASFPIGELRFGRMPFHWGLGLLYHSGDSIDSNYGDQVDGILFSTRMLDHYFSPGYFIAYSGPSGRGGGFMQSAPNFTNVHAVSELGQRYPLETGDITHVLSLSFLKRQSDFITNQKLQEGNAVFNYGLFTSYRRQNLDSQNVSLDASTDRRARVVKRDGNVGLASFWSALSVGTFHLEMELAGIWGKYQIGEKDTDLLASNGGAAALTKRDIWLLQGGVAVESKYGFLSDRLQLGLDGGWASSQAGTGFGIREGSADNPAAGSSDGRKLPTDNGYKTNFKFNPAYGVDLLMYREVLGAITGTFYFKPHLAYFFNRNFGLRSDVIASFAPTKSNTSGDSNLLGAEIDASAFIRTDSGFYFSLAYGVLFPLKGLNHQSSNIGAQNYATFGEARMAQTLQSFIGLSF
jgi:uncharacterized protein (TIGR04551 family)